MTIGSLELSFVLPIIYLLYIVLLIPVTVKKLKKETTYSKHITLKFITMYSINLSTTNSIITRQLFLDDW